MPIFFPTSFLPPSLSLSLFFLKRLRTDGSNLIQDRKYHLQTFKQSFIGREFVDWLITRGEVSTRDEGTILGRQFLDAGVFRHGRERERETVVY